jgi:cell division protein FtsL
MKKLQSPVSRVHTLCFLLFYAVSANATDLVIAKVNNRQIIEMQKHAGEFEKSNADITLKWITGLHPLL